MKTPQGGKAVVKYMRKRRSPCLSIVYLASERKRKLHCLLCGARKAMDRSEDYESIVQNHIHNVCKYTSKEKKK